MNKPTFFSSEYSANFMRLSGPMIVFAAQPGDEVLGCGGALAKAAREGIRARALILVPRDQGRLEASELPTHVAAKESASETAAEILGCDKPQFWKVPSFAYGEDEVRRILEFILDVGASVICAPSFNETHPDRLALALAVREAVRRRGGDRLLAYYGIDVPVSASHALDEYDLLQKKLHAVTHLQSAVPMASGAGESAKECLTPDSREPDGTPLPEIGPIEGYDVWLPERLVDPIPGLARRALRESVATRREAALVTVIVRSMGRKELADALDSVAAQTYRAIEVVLVDVEGLGLLDAGKSCGQFPIRTVSTGEHLGRGAAANAGLDAAVGDYVVFLDDDDWFLPDHVHLLVSALSSSSDARAAYSGIECRSPIDAGGWNVLHTYNDRYDSNRLLVENYIPMHAVLFDRGLLGNSLRFDESLEFLEDWDFWIQLSALTVLKHVDRVSAIYRISETSGFGHRGDHPAVGRSYSALMDKWRARWSDDQLACIAGNAAIMFSMATANAKLGQEQASWLDLPRRVCERDEDATVHRVRVQALEQVVGERDVQIGDLQRVVAANGARIGELELGVSQYQAQVKALKHEVAEGEARIGVLRSRLNAEQDRQSDALGLRARLLRRLDEIQTSASWQLSVPLRAAESRWPRLVRGIAAIPKLAWWTLTLRLQKRLQVRRLATELLETGLFNRTWYIENNPDIVLNGENPVLHWLVSGWTEGRDPNPLVDTDWYLAENRDVAEAGLNPLAHYLASGAVEGRDPNPLFDTDWYLAQCPDLAKRGRNPLAHYLASGAVEGRDPNPLFDTDWYLAQNPDVAEAGLNPLAHFLVIGAAEGRDPNPLFNIPWYLERNPQVAACALNPLVHYQTRGASEHLDPHPLFDTSRYLSSNPDLASLRTDPLTHFLHWGGLEGRDPHALFDSSWYLETNSKVADTRRNPLVHYLERGVELDCDPHPLFDTSWYLEQNPDVRDSGANPLMHYVVSGAWEGRNPNPLFDSARYLKEHPELKGTDITPLQHYLTHHSTDNPIDPHPSFDAASYIKRHRASLPDGMTPLEHFLRRLADSRGVGREYSGRGENGSDVVQQLLNGIGASYERLYASYIEAARREPSNEYFVQESDPPPVEATPAVRAIAYYLPQFHPIPENDAWWGTGFTEWTNVSKAVPQFEGHYQPHLPGELGFYDLRLPEVQRRQIELAKQHGIFGFCYYYYWFAGRRLLERPLNQFLSDPALDFPFCICWANENWTRRWDGQENEVLIKQEHSPETDLKLIDDVIPLFRDPRYIRVQGKPLLIVYRVNLLPEPERTADRWRSRCRELDVEEPYLVAAQTFGIKDPRPYGFDAAVQFPPHNTPAEDITDKLSLLNPVYGGRVYSYRSAVDGQIEVPASEPYPVYGCAFPGWDNEARKPMQGNVYAGASPRLFAEWLDKLCRDACVRTIPDERLVFVNAWNEWAEGAHLEPDRRYGYAYLRATARTVRRFGAGCAKPACASIRWLERSPERGEACVAVIAHVYYPELWGELADYLSNVGELVDLIVTVVREADAVHIRQRLPANVTHCFVGLVPNRGRDIAPFLSCLGIVKDLGYPLALKVHTKGTSTRNDGNEWRRDMLKKVLGSEAATAGIRSLMDSDTRIGLVAPTGHLLPAESFWGRQGEAELNLTHFERLASEVGLPRKTHGFSFPAGSVYWFRPRALGPLLEFSLDKAAFPPESGQRDGSVAHAVERLVGLASSTDGWTTAVTKEANPNEHPTEWISGTAAGSYPFAYPTVDGAPVWQSIAGIR